MGFSGAGGGGSAGLPWINVKSTGADLTGATDSTAALQAAIALIPASGGRIYFPAGSTIKFSGTLNFIQGQGIIADGSDCVTLHYTGSTTAINITVSGTFTGGQYAGSFEGFYIDGYSAGASAVGIQYGNLQGLHMRDVRIYGFQGIGMYFKNAVGQWAEQGNVQVQVTQCGTANLNTSAAVIFDTSSFDYSNFDFMLGVTIAAGGVYLQNGANLQGCFLRIRGNFFGAVTNTAAVLGIDKAGGSGTSYIINTMFDVAVEADGSGTGHYTVYMGSTNSTSQLFGTGVLTFSANTATFQGYQNPNFVPFGFNGLINDTILGTPSPGVGGVSVGGIQLKAAGSLTSLPGGGSTLFFQFGDVIEFQLANGANTLTFSGSPSGKMAQRVDLWIAQPASGAAGTITWPSMKWASATAPTLSATNGFVDHIKLTYLPDTAAWYGELIGTHYA